MGIYKDAQTFGRISTYVVGGYFIILSIIMIITGIRTLISEDKKKDKPEEQNERTSVGETLIVVGIVFLLLCVIAIYIVNKSRFAAAGAGVASLSKIF